MQFQVKKRGDRRVEARPEFRQLGPETIVGSASWIGADGRRQERFQVITLRDGKIIDMQGCKTMREAERFARRHSLINA